MSIRKKETFFYILNKRKVLLITIALLLVASILASPILESYNRKRTGLHRETPPGDLGLKPSEKFSDSGELGSVLTETTPVGPEYFADTLFVGDSLTDGIRIYEYFEDAKVVSKLGINTHTASTEEFYDIGDGRKVTMVEAIEHYKPRKVYIMLGTNGLDWETVQWNLEGYASLIDSILARVPGCYIIVQSIPPATEKKAKSDPHYSIENIAEYNKGLLDLALDKGVYFLDVHSALCGEDGYLNKDIAAGDGNHMKPAGYLLWYEYLIKRAVKGDSAYYIGEDGLIKFVHDEPDLVFDPDEQEEDNE